MNKMTPTKAMSCPMNKQRHNADELWQLPLRTQNDNSIRLDAPRGAPESHHHHHHFHGFGERLAMNDITNAVVGSRLRLPRRQEQEQDENEDTIHHAASEDRGSDSDHA